jgi:hypothetical protein
MMLVRVVMLRRRSRLARRLHGVRGVRGVDVGDLGDGDCRWSGDGGVNGSGSGHVDGDGSRADLSCGEEGYAATSHAALAGASAGFLCCEVNGLIWLREKRRMECRTVARSLGGA